MSSLRNPVGAQPPSVYWRRRLLVGLGVLAVVVVIVLIIVRPGSGEPAAAPTPEPTPSASFTAPSGEVEGEDETPASAGACDPGDIELEAITDSGSYAADTDPKISMSITNTGSDTCTLEVGTAAQEYIVTSGQDRIWSSKDCQTDATEDSVDIAAGKTLSTTPFGWDRTRSSEDTCEGERDGVTGGGASYHLTVKLGDLESAETRQFLLD
ncbi:hypothetical protein [Homoserinibacter sp. YIM 151385]|uniref:hypothetical protein n=1 Tax=Homoserinibacter sp. YIM 151385 TaxID=2985506 RepID=UPI0022F0C28E|nr:hypothetical protein [Homoserinibacter sp. YIM 151385]WBU37572.1 hypothetical protein OF852_11715 [Homoserinibacter sp. YIM 151385]